MGTRKMFARGRLWSPIPAAIVAAVVLGGIGFGATASGASGTVGDTPAASITSDFADYAPGWPVTLTGSGWQPGESVHLVVNDDAGQTWTRDVTVTADDAGTVTDQFTLPDWFVAAYSVTATGAVSGIATTSFTDQVAFGLTAPTFAWHTAGDFSVTVGGTYRCDTNTPANNSCTTATITIGIYPSNGTNNSVSGSAIATKTLTLGTAAAGTPWSWTFDHLSPADGKYDVKASMTFVTGSNGTTPNDKFADDAFGVDTTPPTSAVTSVTQGSPLTASGTASDATSGLNSGNPKPLHVEIRSGSSSGATVAGTGQDLNVAGNGAWSYSTSTFPTAPGTYCVVSQATDQAGNVQSTLGSSCYTVAAADTTAPDSASITIDDGAAWTNDAAGSVSVDISGHDASGVTRYRLATSQAGLASASDVAVSPAETTFSRTDLPFTLSAGEGASKEVWLRLCDAANNCSDASDTIGWDKTPPSITDSGVQSGTAGLNGWYVSAVTNRFHASDSLSGLDAACQAAFPSGDRDVSTGTSEGSSVTVTSGSCSDVAGNTNSGLSSAAFKIDLTPPVITDTGPTPSTPNGSNGWYVSAVSNGFSASDATSGLDSACSTAFPKSVSTGTSEGSSVTVQSGSCSDLAGNTNSGISSGAFKIDLTDPTVAITSPADGLTTIVSSVTVGGTASDTPSGLDTVKVNTLLSTLGTGTFSKSSVALSCGSNTITAVATDEAGRTSSDSIEVTRLCFDLAYQQPIDANAINTGKYGRVIPVKVIVSLKDGGVLTDSDLAGYGLTLQLGVNGGSCSATSATDSVEAYSDAGQSNGGTNLFRWDPTAAQWIYNLDTKAPPGVAMAINSCYRLDVYVSDGTNKVLITNSPYALFKPTK